MAIDFASIQDLERHNLSELKGYRRRYRRAKHPSPEDLDDEIDELNTWISHINARGGQVVFVRMPSSGNRLALEEEYHPKTRYWNRFSARSIGTCIEAPEIWNADGDWVCPDESHLDQETATRFTNALVDELIERGVIPNGRPEAMKNK
jgi:hypothetical protein